MKFNLIIFAYLFFSQIIFGQQKIMISNNQISSSSVIKIKNNNFNVVISKNDTIYLQTTDVKFTTKEGFNVGTKFSDLPKKIKNNLTKEAGWGYFYKLKSDWCIAFCEGSSCTDKYPNEESKIKWIFKRKKRKHF